MTKSLDAQVKLAIDGIKKKFGIDSIMRLGDDPGKLDITFIDTGSLKLNRILGGGIPMGRTVEIFGPQMSGKTTLLLFMIANLQKMTDIDNNLAAFIDAEHAFLPQMAKEYGVDVDNLFLSRPDSGEEAIDIIEALVRTGKFGIIGIDSVSSLVPQAEVESEMAQQHMGLQSRLMSKAMRKLTPIASANNCTLVFINQIREKIGTMYGNPETTSGGRALPFYASTRLAVRMGDQLKDKDKIIGHIVRVKVVKNKITAPFTDTEFNLFYHYGIDTASEIADIAVQENLIKQAGAWFSIVDEEGNIKNHDITGEQLRWQGRNNLQDAFRSDKWLEDTLTRQIKELT